MSFGRLKNVVRRAERPDLDYHRSKRRNGVDHLLAVGSGPRHVSIFRALLDLPRRMMRKLGGR
jgi:hypothetical protein